MKKVTEYAIIGVGGGIYYYLLEVLWRGYSHYSMIILGALSVITLYKISLIDKLSFIVKCVVGAALITLYELLCGIFVNVLLKINVWDYSDLPYNLLGQISPTSSAIWLVLCIPAFYMCQILNNIFRYSGVKNEEEKG